MAWTPVSRTVPQYQDTNGNNYSGAVLKAYSAGTSTNINMATDSSGGTQVGSIALNANGYPEVSSNVVIPHLNESYKLSLYANQSDADANTSALWTQDNITLGGDFLAVTQSLSSNTTLDSTDDQNHLEVTGNTTITQPDVDNVGSGFVSSARNAGTGAVTLAADAGETINGESSLILAPGDFAITATGSDNVAALLGRPAYGGKGSDIASAATTDIWVSDGELIHITGTTGITSFGTPNRAGEVRILIFDDAVTITHNASSLVLPGGVDYTTSANDILIVRADTTSKVYATFHAKPGLDLLSTATASNDATIDFTSNIDSKYTNYYVTWTNVVPVTDGTILNCRISIASSFKSGASDYQWVTVGIRSNSATVVGGVDAADSIISLTSINGIGGGTGECGHGELILTNPSNTTLHKHIKFSSTVQASDAAVTSENGSGSYVAGVEAIDGIRFLFASGNISQGTFKLYGIK